MSFLLMLLLAASDEPPTIPQGTTVVMPVPPHVRGWSLTMILPTGELEKMGPYPSLEACEQDIQKEEKKFNATSGYCEKEPPRPTKP